MPIEAMQAGGTFDVEAMIGDFVQLAFSIGVAWYLLTKTTEAINGLKEEVRAMRIYFEEGRKEIQHQGTNIRQEIRALTDSIHEHK